MNTYLFSKPSFTSPQPLAASSGLTIPLQITLSEIKLSAFIILVFSRQKGLTLVFRNDPLESIKVSSTFDSIPFVCEYLQKEIEMQLKVLMMDELPAIIHRLSLRLWCPEYAAREEEERIAAEKKAEEEIATDPLASPPQDAVDAHGNVLDANEISSLSLEGNLETHSLFSQKNLLRLGVLSDSQRTLSLFTPSIREAVFRAWAGTSERAESSPTFTSPTLSRTESRVSESGTTYTFSDSCIDSHMPCRASQVNLHSATTGLCLGAGRHPRTGRKKKHRVVNLRKKIAGEAVSETDSLATETDSEASSSIGGSEPILTSQIPEEPEEEPLTPPRSPSKAHQVRFRSRGDSIDLGETPRMLRPSLPRTEEIHSPAVSANTASALAQAVSSDTPIPSIETPAPVHPQLLSQFVNEKSYPIRTHRPAFERTWSFPTEKSSRSGMSSAGSNHGGPTYTPYIEGGTGIIEQAWMMSMAAELARRARATVPGNEKIRLGEWESRLRGEEREETPPPAYGA
jgi:distribution and morphology protein 34